MAADDDSGFTITEMLVTMLVLSIIMALTSGILISLNSSSTSVQNSVRSMNSEQTASAAVVQYLHSATAVTAAGPNSLTMTTLAGISDGTGGTGDPLTSTLTLSIANPTASVPYYVFSAQLTNSAGKVTTIETYDSAAPYTYSSSAGTYGTPLTNVYTFSYYNAAGTPLGQSVSDAGTVPTCALGTIARVDIAIPFLTGARGPSTENNDVTTWSTSVYLQSSATVSTTTTVSACAD